MAHEQHGGPRLNMSNYSELSVDLQDVVMTDLRIFEGIEGLVWEGKLIVGGDIEIKVGNSGRGAPNRYKAKTKESRATLKRLKSAAALALSRPDDDECLDWFTAYMDDGDNAEMHIAAITADMKTEHANTCRFEKKNESWDENP